jgi:sec-independent protein translocase protein TatA
VEEMVAFSPGPEWIVVLVVLVLLFGAKKLPELARSVGKSTSEFKKGMSEGASEAEDAGTSGTSEAPASDAADRPTDDKAGTTD